MYTTLCMAPDGEFITDGKFDTIEEAADNSADMGSRWFFYPFHFIVKHEPVGSRESLLRKRVLMSGHGLDHLTGRTVRTAAEYVKSNWEQYVH